ncbi:MAG: aminoacyl-histidine dipeptidase [Ruminococcaceae bacterium]|nr:aminoacyl-histidine dipeptidase [Oscillospiraceae bacterium]
MEYILKDLEPKTVFKFFEEISAIPRGSGNETAVVDYIAAVADYYSLRYRRDDHNNIIIWKKSHRADAPTVLLQGHTDMVCQANAGTEHDFENDGLKLYTEDGYIKAKGTTLGGDDGVAVAYMLALLTSEDEELPNIECLFTSSEEVGMIGAINFDYSDIKSRMMINIDSEEEGVSFVSCAGGVRVELNIDCDMIEERNKLLRIDIKGFSGGHSGVEINADKENAIRILGELLSRMYDLEPFNLVLLEGGTKDNAIPREASAVIASPDPDLYKNIISDFISEKKKIVSNEEKMFKLHTSKNKHMGEMFTFADTSRIINALTLSPNGVLRMSAHIKGLVQTSSNLGIVKAEKGTYHGVHLVRSNNEYEIDNTILLFSRIAKLLGGSYITCDRYPGWDYKSDSKLRELYIERFKDQYGYEPKVEALHAGLECGLISARIPGIDIISIGPNILDIHSPDERMEIASVERTFKLICSIIKSL